MVTRKTTRRVRKGDKKAASKVRIGVEISRPTEQQLEALKEAFHTRAIAVLGLDADGSYTNQSPTRRRRPI